MNFLAHHQLSIRHISANNYFQDYWSSGMLPKPVSPRGAMEWVWTTFFHSFENPAGFSFPGLAVSLALIGCIATGSKDWRKCLLITLPVVVTALAAVLRLYPFSDRLILFVVPVYAVLIGAGVSFLCEGISASFSKSWTGAVLLSVLLFLPGKLALREGLSPGGKEEVRDALEIVSKNAIPGETLYVFYIAVPAFRFYAPFLAMPKLDVVLGAVKREGIEAYQPEVDSLRGRGRVWTLFSHHESGRMRGETAFILKGLDSSGRRIREYQFEGASLYLHDLGSRSKISVPYLCSVPMIMP
jgi:hypothetical protein